MGGSEGVSHYFSLTFHSSLSCVLSIFFAKLREHNFWGHKSKYKTAESHPPEKNISRNQYISDTFLLDTIVCRSISSDTKQQTNTSL